MLILRPRWCPPDFGWRGWLRRFHFQPLLPGVEEFADFVDQLAEAHRVLLFGGKGAEVHPPF